MEHRCAARKPVEIDVVISCPRIGLIRGRAVNVGMGGMFIETDCVVMPMHAPVTVAFQPCADENLVCMQAAGMVVHQNAVGFGMMFDDLDPACRRALGRLLDGHKASSDAPTLAPVGILRTGSTG